MKPPRGIVAGPIAGSPPTLEWIATDRLSVDTAYQRATDGEGSRRIIVGMIREWNWSLCQPLAVARRSDGSLSIVDGQHRWEGALARGDVAHLPCVITSHDSGADEAATFVALNTRRQRLSQGDIFNASLVSGDETARKALHLIEAAGLRHARSHDPSRWQPGEIFCGPAIMRALKRLDERTVSCALVALGEAYEGKVQVRGASILEALYVVYRDHAGHGFDPDKLIEALSLVEQQDLIAEALVHRHGTTLSTREALVAVILNEYRALAEQALAA